MTRFHPASDAAQLLRQVEGVESASQALAAIVLRDLQPLQRLDVMARHKRGERVAIEVLSENGGAFTTRLTMVDAAGVRAVIVTIGESAGKDAH